MLFFTADLHLSHDNIRRYCDRPFSSSEEMDTEIIRRWNEVVGKGDTVWVLGDFAFAHHTKVIRFIEALNGNINFIRGNHDKDLEAALRLMKRPLRDVYSAKDGGDQFWLSHYAHLVWPRSHHGSYHLHGHSHGCLAEDPRARRMDVGVDANNYTPVSVIQVREYMAKKDWKPLRPEREGGKAG